MEKTKNLVKEAASTALGFEPTSESSYRATYGSMSARHAEQYALEAEAHALEARRVAMRALAAVPRATEYDPYSVLSSKRLTPFGVHVD